MVLNLLQQLKWRGQLVWNAVGTTFLGQHGWEQPSNVRLGESQHEMHFDQDTTFKRRRLCWQFVKSPRLYLANFKRRPFGLFLWRMSSRWQPPLSLEYLFVIPQRCASLLTPGIFPSPFFPVTGKLKVVGSSLCPAKKAALVLEAKSPAVSSALKDASYTDKCAFFSLCVMLPGGSTEQHCQAKKQLDHTELKIKRQWSCTYSLCSWLWNEFSKDIEARSIDLLGMS